MCVVQQQTAGLLRLFVLPRSGLLAFVALRGTAHVREALLPRHRTGASRIVCLAPARDRTSGSSFSGKLPKGHSSSSQHPRRFWRGFWCCLANEYVLYLQMWLGSSEVGSWAAPWGGGVDSILSDDIGCAVRDTRLRCSLRHSALPSVGLRHSGVDIDAWIVPLLGTLRGCGPCTLFSRTWLALGATCSSRPLMMLGLFASGPSYALVVVPSAASVLPLRWHCSRRPAATSKTACIETTRSK